MARTADPNSKAGFVRSQPKDATAATIVKRAKAKGIKLDERYVYAVRTQMNRKSRRVSATAPHARVNVSPRPIAGRLGVSSIESAVEAIVERKVNAILQQRVGAMLG